MDTRVHINILGCFFDNVFEVIVFSFLPFITMQITNTASYIIIIVILLPLMDFCLAFSNRFISLSFFSLALSAFNFSASSILSIKSVDVKTCPQDFTFFVGNLAGAIGVFKDCLYLMNKMVVTTKMLHWNFEYLYYFLKEIFEAKKY